MSRYSRHTILPEIGSIGQEKINQAKILVIGAGGLGSSLLLYLAGSGIGSITIFDGDTISASNLPRQILFGEGDLGKNKALVAEGNLRKHNSKIMINSFPSFFLRKEAVNICKAHDLIFDCTDNFLSRYLINDACILANRPLIFGSVNQFDGQVGVFNLRDEIGYSANYRDFFPTPPTNQIIPNCAEAGVLGPLVGVISNIMAIEGLKLIANFGNPLKNQLFLIASLDWKIRNIGIKPNKKNRVNKLILIEDPSCLTVRDIEYKQIKDYLILDVRNRDEQELRQLSLSHIHIPSSRLVDKITEIPRELNVVLVCESGIKSKNAIKFLQTSFGFTNLFNLKNGLNSIVKAE